MSRSTVAKSRAEKGGKSTNAPTPAVTHEIIPGKFNDQDWNFMVDHDEGDDFVLELVEELCESALDVIYQNYLQRQLVPFTVLQAKDALLQIIEWQFLSRDEGETNLEADPGWQQDEEPEPAVTDCWAQGSVPRQAITTPREEVMEEPLVEVEEPAAEEAGEAEAAHPMDSEEAAGTEPAPAEGEGETPGETTLTPKPPSTPKHEETEVTEEPIPSDTKTKSKRRKFRPHYGKLKSAGLSRMTESLEQTEIQMLMAEFSQQSLQMTPEPFTPDDLNMPNSCHSIIKLQAGRPPGNREIMYDTAGNVVRMTRINPERLPTHKVRTGFHVVDPQVEAAQARLEAMRTGRHVKGARSKEPRSMSMKKASSRAAASIAAAQKAQQEILDHMPPSLMENMDVSAGVTLREGDRIKRGPKQTIQRSELVAGAVQQGLKPVTFRATIPSLTVQELLERDSPVIRPLQATPPIPPIQQKAMEMA